MESLHIVLDVLLCLALAVLIWQSHQLRSTDQTHVDAYRAELNRVSNRQSDCATQLRACSMDVEAMEQLNADGK